MPWGPFCRHQIDWFRKTFGLTLLLSLVFQKTCGSGGSLITIWVEWTQNLLSRSHRRPTTATHIRIHTHVHARTPHVPSLPIHSPLARRMRNGRRRKQPSAPHNLTLALSSARIQTFGHESTLSVRQSSIRSCQSLSNGHLTRTSMFTAYMYERR
jgi:hypothetical protein